MWQDARERKQQSNSRARLQKFSDPFGHHFAGVVYQRRGFPGYQLMPS